MALNKSKKTTRQLQAEQTKLLIFDAAMRLLERQDFESITVRDIVREANVSIGSFYNSYPSKMDVFYETYQVADDFFENVVRPKLIQATVCERITCFFEEYATYNSDVSIFALTRVLYNPNNKHFHRKSTHGMLPILTELMKQAKDSGEFHTQQSAEELSRFFMICMRGLVYDWCTQEGSYDLKAQILAYLEHLLRAFI